MSFPILARHCRARGARERAVPVLLLTRPGSTARIGALQRAFEKAAETENQALVTFLHARGLEPTKEQIARIAASKNASEVRGPLCQRSCRLRRVAA